MEQFSRKKSYTITLDDDVLAHRVIAASTNIDSLCFTNTPELMSKIDELNPLAIFIDIKLTPTTSGLDAIPALRRKWPHAPILVVTSSTDDHVLDKALRSGADDLVIKPIRPLELNARLQLRLREANLRKTRHELKCRDLTINTVHGFVKSQRGERSLSPTELNLLTTLAQAVDTVVPRQSLKTQCWGRVSVSEGALDRKVHEVRKVVKDLSQDLRLKTVYGVGISLISEALSD